MSKRKKKETPEEKRERLIAKDAAVIEKELGSFLAESIKVFKDENPGVEGYMYMSGFNLVIDDKLPENPEKVIHVVKP